MIDMGSIAAAVGSLKGASDIAKGLMSLHTMAEVQAKAIELNQTILDAQHQIFAANAAQTTLVERIRELEGQITRMKDWDAQKERYKLAAPFPGVHGVCAAKRHERRRNSALPLCCMLQERPALDTAKQGRNAAQRRRPRSQRVRVF